ncbi:prepilin-type N-terminal cleavage/methylation domain-containing protein [Candidatus Falkowbacteria bacterium]|nr:prepilin-type N-terminal cleavage/methylation domain-containing protein [Candidatus Falkowbacteria bacterium]
MNRTRKITAHNGFTFIEVMVTMAIFTLLTVMISEFLINGLRSNVFGYEQDAAVQNARQTANMIAKEVREAMTSVRGDYMINVVATNTITFFADVDNNGYAEKIRYFTQDANLKRGIISASGTPLNYFANEEKVQTVATYLNNKSLHIFSYYDATSTPIANPTANKNRIRLIHILLKINVTPDRAPADYFYETDVQIRNLKDNL